MTTTGWGSPQNDDTDDDSPDALVLTPFESELLARIDRIADALQPRAGTSIGGGHFAPLLDAEPDDLRAAIDAGATALGDAFPRLRDAFIPSALRQFAEAVIDGALKQAAADDDLEAGAAPTSP